jgi:hypothetical protein
MGRGQNIGKLLTAHFICERLTVLGRIDGEIRRYCSFHLDFLDSHPGECARDERLQIALTARHDPPRRPRIHRDSNIARSLKSARPTISRQARSMYSLSSNA